MAKSGPPWNRRDFIVWCLELKGFPKEENFQEGVDEVIARCAMQNADGTEPFELDVAREVVDNAWKRVYTRRERRSAIFFTIVLIIFALAILSTSLVYC